MLQVFSWGALFVTFLAVLGVTWFFGTVAVGTAQGIEREINLLGIAASIGTLFVGTLLTLFLLVVCASAEALVKLREQRRKENEETAPASSPRFVIVPGVQENGAAKYKRLRPQQRALSARVEPRYDAYGASRKHPIFGDCSFSSASRPAAAVDDIGL
jgi:hypothetical protein